MGIGPQVGGRSGYSGFSGLGTAGSSGFSGFSGAASGGGAIVNGLALSYEPTPSTTQTQDDEFNSSSLDAKWSVINNSVAAVDIDTTWRSHIYLRYSGNQRYTIQQSYAPSGAFSLTMAGFLVSLTNFQGAMIRVRDNSNNAVYAKFVWVNGLQGRLDTLDAGVETNRRTANLFASSQSYAGKFYIQLQRDGSNNWMAWVSYNGLIWVPVGTSVYSKTMTVDNFQIDFLQDTATTTCLVGLDFVRRDWISLTP